MSYKYKSILMKKTLQNIFLLIIALVLSLALIPRILVLEGVQQKITEQLSSSLRSSVKINKLHWVWLPLPHLTLTDTRITSEEIDLVLPKTHVYPHWQLLLGKTEKPGRIHLDDPVIHIKKNILLGEGLTDLIIPEGNIGFENGTLQIDITDEYQDIFRTSSIVFKDFQAKIKLQPKGALFDLRAKAPFSDHLALQGELDFEKQSYRLSIDFQEIKLHQTIKSFGKERLIPVESPDQSTARLQGDVIGIGLQQIEADLHGVLPCFIVKPKDREALLDCGYTKLAFQKSGPLMRLNIKDLEIKDPKLNLSGLLERRLPLKGKVSGAHILTDEAPVWLLDITGSDLDLTAIRKKVLTLWGDNKIARTVSDIVLGGKALSAGYQFSGVAEDFNDIKNMTISAEAQNAAIHVPGVELDLSNASGPIQIKDGILTGQNLSAQMGDSKGRNGTVLLDLKKNGNAFNLDLDIDADIAALPGVLEHLIDHEGFLRELRKFHGATGRATGNLRLGETLDDFVTEVSVTGMDFETRYDPVPDTIVLQGGELQVMPEKVSWQKATGRIGDQQIKSTSGSVNWSGEQVLLNIEELDATLQGNTLYQSLLQTNVMPEKITRVLAGLDGEIELSKTVLLGPAFVPEDWEYKLHLNTQGLTITSPLLPEELFTDQATVILSQKTATISKSHLQFLDQPLYLNGELHHTLLDDWQGWLEINGSLLAKLASWISSKGWFPEKLRPRIPCTLDAMKVSWNGESLGVSGNILTGMGGGRLPMVKIEMQDSPERLHIKELSFYAPGEQGTMALDFHRQSPNTLLFTWDGFAHAETIDALFHYSNFVSGTYSGAISFIYVADKPEKTIFNGLLKAKDLVWKGREKDLSAVIRNLDVNGIGELMKITNLELELGSEKIGARGQIAAEPTGLQVDMNLTSSHVSKDSLSQFISELRSAKQEFKRGDTTDDTTGGIFPAFWDFTGRVGIDFESFSVSRDTSTPYNEARPITYTLYNMHGVIELAPDEIVRTEVFSAKLCGLNFDGFWYSDETLGQKYNVWTDPNHEFYFQKVIPCLGIDQDLIEGVFSLQANLFKESGIWYSGHVHIKSDEGRILRLKTLSKILSIVNITDLFVYDPANVNQRGFPYTRLDVDTHVHDNRLFLDRAIIQGEGLNLFAKGDMNLADFDTDLTMLISPLKSVDRLISKVPLLGSPVIGKDEVFIAVPVAIKGQLTDPEITALHPEAIGSTILDMVKNTMMLPFNILNPEKSKKKVRQPVDSK
jgi:hypothetical protein